MKRKRARDANGRAVLKIEVDQFALADALVDVGMLQTWDAECKIKLGKAVEQLLARMVDLSSDA